MGSGQSSYSIDKQFLQDFESKHKFVQVIENAKLGKISVYSDGQGNLVAKKSTNLESQEKKDIFINQVIQKVGAGINSSPYLLTLLAYDIQNQMSGIFSTRIELSGYIEYFDQNLEQQIYQKHKQYDFYQESELWNYLYQMISAAAALQSNSLHIGDIRPHTIFVTGNNNLKLWPENIFPNDQSLYEKITHREQRCLLAPETLSKFQAGNYYPCENYTLIDSFQIGMTMLELTTLTSTSLCYNYKQFLFQQEFFDDLLNKLANSNYSSALQSFVKMLLIEDPQQRISPLDAFNILKPYEQLILQKKPFQFDQVLSSQVLGYLNYRPNYQTNVVQEYRSPLRLVGSDARQVIQTQIQAPFIQSAAVSPQKKIMAEPEVRVIQDNEQFQLPSKYRVKYVTTTKPVAITEQQKQMILNQSSQQLGPYNRNTLFQQVVQHSAENMISQQGGNIQHMRQVQSVPEKQQYYQYPQQQFQFEQQQQYQYQQQPQQYQQLQEQQQYVTNIPSQLQYQQQSYQQMIKPEPQSNQFQTLGYNQIQYQTQQFMQQQPQQMNVLQEPRNLKEIQKKYNLQNLNIKKGQVVYEDQQPLTPEFTGTKFNYDIQHLQSQYKNY